MFVDFNTNSECGFLYCNSFDGHFMYMYYTPLHIFGKILISMFRLVLWSYRCSILRTSRQCSSIPLPDSSQPPQEPPKEACCGQGCANCVWLEYGNQLIDYYSDLRKEDMLLEIEKMVTNPVVRAFVVTELRMKWKNS